MITHLDSTTTVKQLKNRSRELMLQSYDRTYMHEAEIKKKKHQKKNEKRRNEVALPHCQAKPTQTSAPSALSSPIGLKASENIKFQAT